MATSVTTFTPTNYLTQLKGAKPLTAVANTETQPNPVQPAKPAENTSTPPVTASTPGNLLGLSSAVLSVLQETSSNSTNGGLVSALTGGTSSGPLGGLFNALLTDESAVRPTQTAIEATQQTSGNTSPVQNLINSAHSTANANNAALIKQAQNVINQGKGLLA